MKSILKRSLLMTAALFGLMAGFGAKDADACMFGRKNRCHGGHRAACQPAHHCGDSCGHHATKCETPKKCCDGSGCAKCKPEAKKCCDGSGCAKCKPEAKKCCDGSGCSKCKPAAHHASSCSTCSGHGHRRVAMRPVMRGCWGGRCG